MSAEQGPGPAALPIDLRPAGRSVKLIEPTAGYFRAGHRRLDSVTHALPAGARNGPKTTSARPRPADVPPPQATLEASVPGPPQAAANPAAHAAPSRQQMQSRTCADSVPGESPAVI
jgi:hypothetical protein